MVVLAELEIFCSRPHAPTRRVAPGTSLLPCDPAPGPGGVLLAGVVAAHVDDLDPESIDDLDALTQQVEAGRRIAQPRLRHRFQHDTIGLSPTRHRLVGDADRLWFEFDDGGAPEQQVLGAIYAAGALAPADRRTVMALVRRSLTWLGPVGPKFIAAMSGAGHGELVSRLAVENPLAWALDRLGFVRTSLSAPPEREVQKRYRQLLREAHPDHGAADDGAAQRIAELGAARRILIGR